MDLADPKAAASSSSPGTHARTSKGAPNLPPAQIQQVVQYLLAKNYYLTALELLVESQQAGKLEEVAELQRFFSDQDKFPPEELSKHQNANALDMQTQAKEREERLQLVEYELRLAKEDLAEMHRKLEQATKQASLASATSLSAAPGTMSKAASQQLSGGGAAQVLSPRLGGGSIAASPRASIDSPGARASGAPDPPQQRHGGGGEPGPSPQEVEVINSAVLSHLLHHKLRMTALTLQEEAALGEETPSLLAAVGGWEQGGPGPEPGLELWRWLKLAQHARAADPGSSCNPLPDQAQAQEGPELQRLQQELDQALQQLEQLKQSSPPPPTSAGSSGSLGPLPSLPSLQTPGPSAAAAAAAGSGTSPSFFLTLTSFASSMPSDSSLMRPPTPHTQSLPDPALHGRLAALVAQLPELLSRMVPNLTMKARLELLPLLEGIVTETPCTPEQQVALASLVLNLIPNPDEAQRLALLQSLERLGGHFGASWVAVELLPLCIKQVNSPSSERRTLAAQLLGSFSELLELSVHAHVLLTQLHRLAEDRIDAVREAAVHALSRLLSRLQYSRQYYLVVEELVAALGCDAAPPVAAAVKAALLPALLAWAAAAPGAVVATSLLPKVVGELGRRVRAAAAQHAPAPPPAAAPGAQAASIAFAGTALSYTYAVPQLPSGYPAPQPASALALRSSPAAGGNGAANPRFPNHDYQVAYQLLLLYGQLLPDLRRSALRSCPGPLAAAAGLAPPGEEAADDDAQGEYAGPAAAPLSASSADLPAERADALFEAWASSPESGQWKSLQWVVQFLVPELLDLCRLVPVCPETLDVRCQLALAFQGTAAAFGPGFAGVALLPLLAAAAGAGAVGQPRPPAQLLGRRVPDHLQESAADLMPRLPEAARAARERVLPQLLAGLMPAAGLLAPFLSDVLAQAHTAEGRWVLEALQELQASVAFISEVHGQAHVSEVLGVLEQSVGGGGTTPGQGPSPGQGPGPMGTDPNTARRLGMVAMAKGLMPGLAAAAAGAGAGAALKAAAKTEVRGAEAAAAGSAALAGRETMKRRLLPLLMVLLSRGDSVVQSACVWALLEVMLRFGEDTKLTEQVFVVFDGLLESAAPEVAAAVLGCAARLAAAVAPSAARSAASAGQLEWVLSTVQTLTHHLLQPPAAPAPAPGAPARPGSGSPEDQRALAAQLVNIVYTVYAQDVRLPRMQHLVAGCIEALKGCRHLLSDQQAYAIQAMSKEKPGTAAISDIMSRAPPTPPPPAPMLGLPPMPHAGGPAHAAAGATPGPGGAEGQNGESSGMRARFEKLRNKLSRRGASQDAAQGGPLQQYNSAGASPPPPSSGPSKAGGLRPFASVSVMSAGGDGMPPVVEVPSSISLHYQVPGSSSGGGAGPSRTKSSADNFFSDDEG